MTEEGAAVVQLQAKGHQPPAEAGKRQGRGSPGLPTQGFRSSRTGREYISVVLSHPVCGVCYAVESEFTLTTSSGRTPDQQA